ATVPLFIPPMLVPPRRRTTKFSSGAGWKESHATKSRHAGPVCCNGWFGLNDPGCPLSPSLPCLATLSRVFEKEPKGQEPAVQNQANDHLVHPVPYGLLSRQPVVRPIRRRYPSDGNVFLDFLRSYQVNLDLAFPDQAGQRPECGWDDDHGRQDHGRETC